MSRFIRLRFFAIVSGYSKKPSIDNSWKTSSRSVANWRKPYGAPNLPMSGDARHDLHGNVPDTAHTGLLIIDMINEFSFSDAAMMFPAIIGVAERIAALKQRVKAAGLPVIDVNDNFGKWQSDLRKL